MGNRMQEMEVARQAASIGGEIVARYFREGVTMRSKATSDLVSDADVESEQAIVDYIHQHFPEHAVLGEESHAGDTTAEHLWIIDPLDGTSNFAHQIPHFAIAIAYFHRGQAQCGVIYNPIRDDWYTVVRGEGAFHNGRKVHVADNARLNEVLIGVGFYYDRGAMMEATLSAIRELFQQNIHGIRRFGTASLDLCQVATGSFGAFFEYELAAWDFTAGQLFVEEAGGRVTTCAGDETPLARTSVLATNGTLHPAVLEIVRKHLPGT